MALFPVRKIQDGGRRHLAKISNGHISATGRPIHPMFGSRVGFSGMADLMALFPVRKIQDGGRRHLRHLGKISNGHISATGRPNHSMFGSSVEFSGTADLMALFLPTTCTASLLAASTTNPGVSLCWHHQLYHINC